jgi:hemerythrin-like domain-containing protein
MPTGLSARPLELDPIPENLLGEPVEYIYADHFRQRCVCVALDEMMAHPDDPAISTWAGALLSYIEGDLPLHIADEEQSLFPLLRRRCKPEDRIDQVLGLLSEEHERDEALAAHLVAGLKRVAAGVASPSWDAFWRVATAFSETQRRHLSWENTVVLPLARKRLNVADMVTLGREMAARRSAVSPS